MYSNGNGTGIGIGLFNQNGLIHNFKYNIIKSLNCL